jgi:hypothetical protein
VTVEPTYKIVIIPGRKGFEVFLYYRMINPLRKDSGATWDMDQSVYARTYWGAQFAAWRLNRRMQNPIYTLPTTAYEGTGKK